MPKRKTKDRKRRIIHTIATAVSRIFDPVVVFVPCIALALIRSGVAFWQQMLFLAVFFCAMVIPPIALMYWAISKNIVSDWDIGNRKERVRALGVLLILAVFDIGIVYLLGNLFMLRLFVFLTMWLFGFFAVTIVWKISGHTGVATLFVGLVAVWFGHEWLVLGVTLPVIAWARVVREDHTPAQVIAGIAYSAALVYFYSQVLL